MLSLTKKRHILLLSFSVTMLRKSLLVSFTSEFEANHSPLGPDSKIFRVLAGHYGQVSLFVLVVVNDDLL